MSDGYARLPTNHPERFMHVPAAVLEKALSETVRVDIRRPEICGQPIRIENTGSLLPPPDVNLKAYPAIHQAQHWTGWYEDANGMVVGFRDLFGGFHRASNYTISPPDYQPWPWNDPEEDEYIIEVFARRTTGGETTDILRAAERASAARILFKFPTRSRPQIAGLTLAGWMAGQCTDRVDYLISLDHDDPKLRAYKEILPRLPRPVHIRVGKSANKIHAVNRDIADWKGSWDVLVCGSDDMVCAQPGWDQIVLETMMRWFPTLDGALHYPDGNRSDLITFGILGRRLYEAFGYVYDPAYRSLWSDNEFTETCQALNRTHFEDRVVARHRHHSIKGGHPRDALYQRNGACMGVDRETYERRRSAGFDIERVRAALDNPK